MTYKKVPDIVRGHEIWLEHDMQHVHIGETVECRVLYGHNMAIDGMANIEGVKAGVFNPLNEKHDLLAECEDDYLVLRFDPDKGIEGQYDEKVITAIFTVMGVH